MLFAKDAPRENIVVRGARVLDPVEVWMRCSTCASTTA